MKQSKKAPSAGAPRSPFIESLIGVCAALIVVAFLTGVSPSRTLSPVRPASSSASRGSAALAAAPVSPTWSLTSNPESFLEAPDARDATAAGEGGGANSGAGSGVVAPEPEPAPPASWWGGGGSDAAAAAEPAPPAAAPAVARPARAALTVSNGPALGAFYAGDSARVTELGRIVVIGAGRAVGSALVALLAARGDAVKVRAVDDGTTGFVTAVDFSVVLDEANVTATGELARVLDAAAGGADTVFVDVDPSSLIVWGEGAAPAIVSLACALVDPGFGVAGSLSRVIFLHRPAHTSAHSLDALLDDCDSSGVVRGGGGADSSISWPRVAVVDWGVAVPVGVGVDPTAPDADANEPITAGFACLARRADAYAYEQHNFETSAVLDLFFGDTVRADGTHGVCFDALEALARAASSRALHSANAAGDALLAAEALLPPAEGGAAGIPARVDGPPTLVVLKRSVAESAGAALVPLPTVVDGKTMRNGLPSLSVFAPADGVLALTNALKTALEAAASASADPGAAALVDVVWWVWRQAFMRGFRQPEPMPVYDPATVVSFGTSSDARYSIHELCTFGVSHASGHVKMRHAAAIWGWRFKRGGIPWSSTQRDEFVPVRVIDPPQGSHYSLLTLRTMRIWKWALDVYPRHKWYIRMWDDVFPVVERYIDIANSFNAEGKLAVGRVTSHEIRKAYLSGGPPGLFSAGWAALLHKHYDTCMTLFEAFKGGGGTLPTLRGRGVDRNNERLRARNVETHCDLGCEDLVIEWCLRDVVGEYYELVHWTGLDSLAPSVINDKALYDCKAMACRRRVIARGDPNDLTPIHMVCFHYVKPWEMIKADKELYGMTAGSEEWVSMCEAAQRRPECESEVIWMPLPDPKS